MSIKKYLSDENLIYAFSFLEKLRTVGIKKIMRAFRKNTIKIEDVFKNSIKEVEKDNNDIIDFEEFKESNVYVIENFKYNLFFFIFFLYISQETFYYLD